jgi:hypothetical protein
MLCSNSSLCCAQTAVYVVLKQQFMLCSNSSLCCAQTAVYVVFKQQFMLCSNSSLCCVQTAVYVVFKQLFMLCSNSNLCCVQTAVSYCEVKTFNILQSKIQSYRNDSKDTKTSYTDSLPLFIAFIELLNF